MERIRLDIIPKGLMPVCHASQYDDGRVIRLDLMDGLQGYSLTDEEIELDVRKPDGHIVTASVDVVAGNTFVDIVTTEQMCAVEGENICELKISKDGAEIYSLNFRMVVEKSVLEGGDPSESFIHNLNQQIYDAVAEQYTGEVIFDAVPTENHGTGYAVTSEGVKNAISEAVPDALNDLSDVDIDNPTSNQALVFNPVTQKWENGEVSTVGGLNDLNDVTIDDVTLSDKQELVYDNADAVFKNKTTRVELTQAEYDQLVADDDVLPDVDYYITDAPSMQGTSADLSYDGTTKSTYTKIEEVVDYIDSAVATTTPTITPNTLYSVTVAKNSSAKIGKFVCVSCRFNLTIGEGGWNKIASINANPIDETRTTFMLSATNMVGGGVRVTTSGDIELYTLAAISSANIEVNICYQSTN